MSRFVIATDMKCCQLLFKRYVAWHKRLLVKSLSNWTSTTVQGDEACIELPLAGIPI